MELSPFADRWARSSVPSDKWAHMLAVADVMLPLPAACTRSQPKHFNEHLMLCPLPRRRRCPFLTGRSVVVDGAWNGPNPPTSAVRWRTRAPRASGCGRFRRWIGFQFRTDVLCRGGRRQDGEAHNTNRTHLLCLSPTIRRTGAMDVGERVQPETGSSS
uniref:Uncharacterized protein n=1 Tax=Oryza glumipatula TaxID=40148 RepID=A0A0E0A5N8_9ORYZ